MAVQSSILSAPGTVNFQRLFSSSEVAHLPLATAAPTLIVNPLGSATVSYNVLISGAGVNYINLLARTQGAPFNAWTTPLILTLPLFGYLQVVFTELTGGYAEVELITP